MLLGNYSEKPLVNYLWRHIPDLESIIIIDKDGEIIHQKMSQKFKEKFDFDRLKHITRKISFRFSINGFDKELGGLAMTINLFKNDMFMLVRSLNQMHLLVLLMPIHYDISKTINVMKGITEWPIDL